MALRRPRSGAPVRPGRRRRRSRGQSPPRGASQAGHPSGLQPDRAPGPSTATGERLDEVAEDLQPRASGLLGVELDSPEVPPAHGGTQRRAVFAGGHGGRTDLCGVSVDEVHPGTFRQARKERFTVCDVEAVPLHLRTLHATRDASDPPLDHAEALTAGGLVAAVKQHLHSHTDTQEGPAAGGSVDSGFPRSIGQP